MTSTQHPVLTSFTLGGIHLKNRVAVAPMSRVSTRGDGIPTKQMVQYYAAFAEGNFSLIITEGTYTDRAYSQSYINQPAIVTEQQMERWHKVVEVVHAAGSAIFIQLMHAGALCQGNHHRDHTVGPSAVQPKGQKMEEYGGGQGAFPMPKAMTEVEIQEAIAGFAQSTLNAKNIGFDGVEIHGANGYLIDQFITDYTNLRTDQYGGPIENRIRFAVEVVEAVRQTVGNNYPVGIRLSQTKVNDFEYRWPGGEADGRVIFSALRKAGVDFIHLASEGRDWIETAMIGDGITITQLAKQVAQVPIIANGGMHQPEQANRIIQEGHADIVSLGRGALANPDWPRRLALGQTFDYFDHCMIQPQASINNTQQWLSQQIA
ncbi:MAG: NADH:flavin oxidoreductase [Trichormus sp. ATA11-4-KO1]|jgi:2,4-dienoyl-CoA reductase-like NADH-dependent reductase (Old Yellow Enzyme family)|nr:NADH:flavin oxidoreductase [Trichormus sp. ATA11-4-KO1]